MQKANCKRAENQMTNDSDRAIRARDPLDGLRDAIPPFPSFGEIDAAASNAVQRQIVAAVKPVATASP
jgi:hypothetical protein